MTRKEEMIIESQKRYDDITFLDGVKWADEHPNLESLWHDINIVPSENKSKNKSENKGIIYLTKNNKLGVINLIKSNNWDWYADKYSIIKWAYIDDLLPKGSKK